MKSRTPGPPVRQWTATYLRLLRTMSTRRRLWRGTTLASVTPGRARRRMRREPRGQEQYQDETEVTGVTAARSAQAAAEETGSGYGAPRAAATEQGYGAPDGSGEVEASGEAAARTEDGYSAPGGDYGAPSSRAEEAY